MKWTPFADIDPDIKLALQRRKRRLINRNLKEYSKTSFIKVWPVSLIELSTTDEDFKGLSDTDKTNAAADRYVLGMQAGGVKDPLSSYKNKYNRPAAGITGLSVQYEGFSGKGLVKMQLKGVINTLEDLDIYKPILFSPGKYWVLEWGYLPDPDKKSGDGIHNNVINTGTITDLYAAKDMIAIFDEVEKHRVTTKGTAEIQVAVVNNYEYTLNAAGSFEFTVDFTGNSTLFKNFQTGAVGSGFRAEAATMTYEDGTPLTKTEREEALARYKKNPSLASAEKITIIYPGEEEKPQQKFYKGDQRSGLLKAVSSFVGSPLPMAGDSMVQGIEEKFKAATPNDFFRNLKTYIQECYKVTTTDVEPKNPWTQLGHHGQRQYSHEEKLKRYGMYYEVVPGAVNQAGQKFDYGVFNNEIGPYVTWGWFEDNILNVVYGKNRDKTHPIKWESIDQDGIPLPLNSHKYLYTTTPDKLIIPGRMPDMLENKWDSEEGDLPKGVYAESLEDNTTMGSTPIPTPEYMAGTLLQDLRTQGFENFREEQAEAQVLDPGLKVESIFGAYHPIVHDYIRISEAALGFDEDISIQAFESDAVGGGLADLTGLDKNEIAGLVGYATEVDLYDKREVFFRAKSDLRGSIRRLVLHYSLIQESFINAATPLEGLKTLLNKIEGMGYKGFWDFKVFEVDDKIGVYEKNSLTAAGDYAIEKVKNQIIDSTLQLETPPIGDTFVFPTWNKDGGFVLNQNLTVKMPSSTMLAMVYGNSLAGQAALQNKSFGDDDSAQLFSIISAGKSTIQKINVDPGFQGSLIDVVKHIDESGEKQTTKIGIRKTWDKIKSQKQPNKKAAVKYKFVGAKSIPIDAVEGSIFERGVSIDAYGIMYDNVKQVIELEITKNLGAVRRAVEKNIR